MPMHGETDTALNKSPTAWWKVIARDGGLLLALLALCEVILRLVAPNYSGNVFDNRYTGGHELALNTAGYRGPLPTKEKPTKELRILALGDSVTFGTGVAEEATWPRQLESLLAARLQTPVVVINGGMPAADLRQLAVAYEETWATYDPDVVIVMLTGNMVSFAMARRDHAAIPPRGKFPTDAQLSTAERIKVTTKRILQNLNIPSFVAQQSQRALFWLGLAQHDLPEDDLVGALPAYGLRQSGIDPKIALEAWELAELNLGELAQRVRRDEAPVLVGFSPARFTITDAVSDNEKLVPTERLSIDPVQETQLACEKLGVRPVSLLAALRRARMEAGAPLYLNMDYTHFDSDGHRVVAQAFAEAVNTPRARLRTGSKDTP